MASYTKVTSTDLPLLETGIGERDQLPSLLRSPRPSMGQSDIKVQSVVTPETHRPLEKESWSGSLAKPEEPSLPVCSAKEDSRTCATRFAVAWPWLALQMVAILSELFEMATRTCKSEHHVQWVLLVVSASTVYCTDIAVRICGFGITAFFSKCWNCTDALVVFVTSSWTLLDILGVPFARVRCIGTYAWAFRALRLLRLLRMAAMIRGVSLNVCRCMRRIVGGRKRRLVNMELDFDLDLCYVTPRMIAMSVPAADCVTRLYRNPLPEVVRFFELFHAQRYLIFNVCPELPYPPSAFRTGRVECFDVQDHTPPLLSDFVNFLRKAGEWYDADPRNILAVHCKGGKGRTGAFCSAWLLYTREAEDTEGALAFFAKARLRGVDTPSQVRYVEYVHQLLQDQGTYYPRCVRPPLTTNVHLLEFKVFDLWKAPPGELLVAIHDVAARKVVRWAPLVDGSCDLSGTQIEGDARLSVFGCNGLPQGADLQSVRRKEAQQADAMHHCVEAGKEPGCLFYFIFHTSFLVDSQLRVPMKMLDGASKRHELYSESGHVSLSFSMDCA